MVRGHIAAVSTNFGRQSSLVPGGKLDPNNSDKEDTNSKGMDCMQIFTTITHMLLGIYPTGQEAHQCLVQQDGKWEALADAIYQVGCFLKS